MRPIQKLHQVFMMLCSLVGMAAAGYLFATASYNFESNLRYTVAQLVVFAALFGLSLLLFLATSFGASKPLRWFGVMGSFTGSGLYVIYLALLVSFYEGGSFGTFASISLGCVGVLSILLGLAWHEKDTSSYYGLLSD
ncbi:hypothetical protein LEN26_019406 [Aphanomyces euteiches]|nr:hypothetical protein LEN26_019406 [Aphanomyces euteiches]KAH9128477.1 hypothetical protein AeMF1_001361 [Aphanomyces euteiches]KAH9195625.1 hypothetical protein AeNC1_002409 [Aphanomyces euteiches]